MALPEPVARSGRETRLLLVTIAVSVAVLLLLARFRFPEAAADPPATAAAAPLERLAARAVYDELASTMADLERRLSNRVLVLRVDPQRESGAYVVAPRMTPDRAVVLLRAGEALPGRDANNGGIIARDLAREIALLGVPADAEAVVAPRAGTPRPGPRYLVVVEGNADGLTLRPVYVARTVASEEARTATPLLALTGIQYQIPRGAAIFSLDGLFIGLVAESGATTAVVPGDFLRSAAEAAVAASVRPVGHLGLDIQTLTDALARASGAARGVMVNHVHSPGPAAGILEPGDVIQALNGTPITTVAGLRQLEQTLAPDATATLSIIRRRTPQEVTVRASNGDVPSPAKTRDDLGFIGRPIADAGIEIVAVHGGSPAARAGLQRGDLIVAVDGRDAPSLSELLRTFRAAPPDTALLVTVQRGQQHHVVALEKR